MKKTMLLILSVCIGMCAYAQNKFEQGYFINNSGQKVECLIKNDDWKNNPSNFKYKTSEAGDVVTGNLSNVQEFGIAGKSKYQKFTVDIDRSSKRVQELNTKRTPEFSSETLFLKVLVEGSRANLYSYVDGALKRYFYTSTSKQITQLIYRFYKSESGGVRTNESYKTQLKDNLPCANADSNLKYTRNELVKYFLAYNNCESQDASIVDYTLRDTKGKLRFKVKGGN
jgi:hypothetical protein